MKDLIKINSRLFLFQVMEYGFNEKLIDDAFLYEFKKQGAQMSFAFAKRYYSVVYESYLKHASHCVLGIMNIGLLEIAGNQLNDAIMVLIQKGYIGLFREGWTRVLNLVQYARNAERISFKTEFEWEKDFSESFSAEPGREWIGYDEYLINMVMYYGSSRGKMEQINYFDVLGIDSKSTTGEIKKVYRKLALKYHPDHDSSKAGRRIFSRITKAYKVLVDPVRKDEYVKGQSLNVTDSHG